MAINNTEKNSAFMEFPMAFSRQDSFPLDKTSQYGSYTEAQTYAQTSPLAYVGQVLSVVENGESKQYQIKDTAGTLEPLGGLGDIGSLRMMKSKRCSPKYSLMTITLNRRNQICLTTPRT